MLGMYCIAEKYHVTRTTDSAYFAARSPKVVCYDGDRLN